MFTKGEIDGFGRLVMRVVKNARLFDATLDFLELGRENGIKVEENIFFLGEYRRLLLDSLVLGICHILIDKPCNKPCECRNAKSKMQIELDSVEEKLESDISKEKPSENFSVAQKKEILSELKTIRGSQEYKKAIDAIKTMRNKRVAHFDNTGVKNKSLFYSQIKLVADNIRRCYEIRQLVLHSKSVDIKIPATDYNHKNVIEALVLHREVKGLKHKYNESEQRRQDKWYSCLLEFWNEKVKPELERSKEL